MKFCRKILNELSLVRKSNLSAKIYDYAKICNSILSIDPKIRFVGVINERGRLVAGGMRENVEALESEKDNEMIFMELALRVKNEKRI